MALSDMSAPLRRPRRAAPFPWQVGQRCPTAALDRGGGEAQQDQGEEAEEGQEEGQQGQEVGDSLRYERTLAPGSPQIICSTLALQKFKCRPQREMPTQP